MIEDIKIFEAENNSDADVLKNAEELFISYAEWVQVREIEKLARQYAELPAGSKNKRVVSRKLQREFTCIEGEPLYHLILNEVKDAGARYPDRIDSLGKSAGADKARERISSFFGSQGFEGAYPSSRKMSPFKGLRMIQMENPVDAEIFWNEKNMTSLINCCEGCIDGELAVSYVAGTVFLKDNQADLFHGLTADSGFFNDKKKRRRGRAIVNQTYRNNSGHLSVQDENLKAAEIASRISQCERISKEERKEYFFLGSDNIGIIVSVVFGLLLSIMLCAGFVLMAIAAGCIIEGSFLLNCYSAYPDICISCLAALVPGLPYFFYLQ